MASEPHAVTGDPARAAPAALVPVLVFVGTVTAVVSSLGAPLLPSIAKVDHVSLGDAQWSLTVTMLVGAVASPVMGRLGDGPRRRLVILGGLAVVVVGSALAALPGAGFALLVTGRGMQGFGLGLMPLTMAVARDHLPETRARRVIALLSIAGAAGVGLGYPVTGLLDERFGLRSAFWFGAVVAGAALLACWRALPRGSTVTASPLDLHGAVLLGGALLALLLAVTEGRSWGWLSIRVLGLAAVAAAGSALWVRRERAADHPLVDLAVLRHPVVAGANLAALLIAMAMYMFLPLLTDFVQTPPRVGYGLGASVIVAGLMLLPFSVTSTAMSRVAGWFGARFGEGAVIPTGSVVLALALVSFAVSGHALWQGFAAMGLAGVGVGFTFAAMPGLIVRSVPLEETGSALGFYQVVRYVGFACGSALSATLLAVYTPAGRSLPQRSGFTVALGVGAGICAATALFGAWMGRSRLRAPALPASGAAGLGDLMAETGELAGAGLAAAEDADTVRTVLGDRSGDRR